MLPKRTTGWIGFDIGCSGAKAAQVVRQGGQFKIRTAAIVPRRERWDAAALTAEEVQSSADELLAAASICDNLSGRNACAVLPMVLCDAVQVDAAVQRQGGAELAAVVEAELHQSLEGYVLGAWPASLQTEKSNVMALPGAWSDQVSADVRGGRWNCRQLDALPWALARAVRMSEGAMSPRTVAALDWGYARATLCLIHDGAPALVRCLKDCGFQDAVAQTASKLRLPESDAEMLLRSRGLGAGHASPGDIAPATAAERIIAEALAEPLDRLERELRRTLSYWQGQTRGVKPEAVVLFGGGGSLVGIEDRLRRALDLDVQRWTLPLENPADAHRLPPAYMLGPALAASALAWEASWPTA
jgi:Tfp pilus assembly PilM family ATPase